MSGVGDDKMKITQASTLGVLVEYINTLDICNILYRLTGYYIPLTRILCRPGPHQTEWGFLNNHISDRYQSSCDALECIREPPVQAQRNPYSKEILLSTSSST